MSIVFQHWNPLYFEAILHGALDRGLDLRAAISQVGDPIWSMHKKKNKESVLAGEMILTFHKTNNQNRRRPAEPFDAEAAIDRMISQVTSNRLYGESLFNRLIIEAWKKGAIASIATSRSDFDKILEARGWRYSSTQHCWTKDQGTDTPFFENLGQ